MKIEYLSGYNFLVEVEGKTLSVSCKGLGGADTSQDMGADGISAIITVLREALTNGYNPTDIQTFFKTFGYRGAIALIEAIYPNEFEGYWRNLLGSLKYYGFGYSFPKVLRMASGIQSKVNHHMNIPYLQRLAEICTNASPAEFDDELSKALIKRFDKFQDASADGIQVSFLRAESNTYVYEINGSEVVFCKRNGGADISTHTILNICMGIRYTVTTQGNLKLFTKRWGGFFVFRVMAAVCPEEAYLYFENMARAATERREPIVTRKILKDHNCRSIDPSNETFINGILGMLEEMRNAQCSPLLEGNKDELEKGDKWRLFYMKNPLVQEAFYYTIDFFGINENEMREETLSFFRAIYKYGGGGSSDCANRVYRYAKVTLKWLRHLSETGISSLYELENRHVVALISKMREDNRSVNHIAEVLIFLRKMHRFIAYERFNTDAVFGDIRIPNRATAMKHIVPATSKAMSAVEELYSELRDCIVLADKLFKALEARANDIFQLPADCVGQADDSTFFVAYTSSKTGKRCKKEIPRWLASEIDDYAEDTTELREALGVNILLVYQAERRAESKVQPQILSASKFRYHIANLLEKNGVEDIQGKSATQSARQIRAAAGKKRFASGQTALQVAQALGNSETTAFHNYRQLDYREYAELRRDYYKRDMKHLTRPRKPLTQPESVPNYVDYGRCTKETLCNCVNICSQCPSRIIRRGDHI